MSVSAIVILLVILAIVLIVLFFAFYKRASKEVAFVRTGFGGEKVVKSGGAIVIPGLHEVIGVSMNTLRLEVLRSNERAVISKDRMRVDVTADFYVRVAPDLNSISTAASTLGGRTKSSEALKELVEGKFVDAIRSIAAEMTMEELHEQRKTFMAKVREAVAEDLAKNGLELEAASLTQLDQTDMSYFNPSNAFDAEGLVRLTERIETRKKTRNDIEQDTQIQIRDKNLQTEKLRLNLEREEHYARLEQELEVETRKAEQATEIARRRSQQSQEADQADIVARQKVEVARIISDREVEQERQDRERILKQREIDNQKLVELADQVREAEISLGSKQTSQARAEAEAARAELVAAEEKVVTAREREAAERRKAIELIEAAREAERQALALKVTAQAEKEAAADRAEAARIEAEGEKVSLQARAEGTRALNEARNILTPEQTAAEIRKYLIDHLPEITRESVKPFEKVDSIKVVQADGLFGPEGAGGSEYDRIFNSALKLKAKAPFLDSLLKDVGLDGINFESTHGGEPKPGTKPKEGK